MLIHPGGLISDNVWCGTQQKWIEGNFGTEPTADRRHSGCEQRLGDTHS